MSQEFLIANVFVVCAVAGVILSLVVLYILAMRVRREDVLSYRDEIMLSDFLLSLHEAFKREYNASEQS